MCDGSAGGPVYKAVIFEWITAMACRNAVSSSPELRLRESRCDRCPLEGDDDRATNRICGRRRFQDMPFRIRQCLEAAFVSRGSTVVERVDVDLTLFAIHPARPRAGHERATRSDAGGISQSR